MTALLLLVHGALLWGGVARWGLGDAAWAPAILAFLVGVPGVYWARLLAGGPRSRLRHASLIFLCGWTHLLLAVLCFSWLGTSLAIGAKLLALWAGVPALWWQRRGRPAPALESWRRSEGILVGGAVLMAGVLAALPAALQLGSDAPAHVGAVVDALRGGRWIPPDLSYPGASGNPDPRFGLAHGLYACIAMLCGDSPSAVFARLPILLAPFLLLVRHELFRALGAPRGLAVAAALLFALTDGDGRGYSLWSASYPGHLALGIALLAAAAILRRRRSAAEWGVTWVAVLALALSSRVHPFGWFVCIAWLATATLLEGRNRAGHHLFWPTVGAAGLGLVFLSPLILEREAAPWHAIPTDALFIFGDWFVIDPLSFARWAGTATFFALLAAPLLRVTTRRVILAAGLVVVALSFVPFSTTLMWKLVSYLLVRTGRIFPTTLVLLWGLWLSWQGIRDRRWLRATALAALCLGGLLQEARAVRWLVRGDSPSAVAPVERSLDEIAGTRWVRDVGIPLASPRIAHGLRARVGGTAWAIPLAHTSPADADIGQRLDLLREVYSPRSSYSQFREALTRTAAPALLTVDNLPRSEDYAYVSSAEWERKLAARLDSLGVKRLASGADWRIYDTRQLPDVGWSSAPADSSRPLPAFDIAVGEDSPFRVVATEFSSATTSVGGEIEATVWYRSNPETAVRSPWSQLELGFDLVDSGMPPALSAVAKPIRKLLLERRGRSSTRWGKTWIPFDGGEKWASDRETVRKETVLLQVPADVDAGEYRVWMRVSERPWRVQRHLADYFSDARPGAVALPTRLKVLAN